MTLQFVFDVLVFIATVGAGLMAGIYFSFSTFVMRSLDSLTPKAAVAAMNAINLVIVKSWFLPLFFATTMLYAVLALFTFRGGSEVEVHAVLYAAVIYVMGMFFITLLFNVPLNNKLATVDKQFEKSWRRYLKYWIRWNHVRTLSCITTHVLGLGYFVRAM